VKIGDRVQHKIRHDVVGTVDSFGKYGAVFVNLSDERGIIFRRFHISSLKVIENEKDS